ncbi:MULTISPECIES: T9SS type B sorting domain-containing protein [Flavobacteriaceae]|uniref:T9SS type B sorting domain-containing protein n=1 Tax=Flavobacteriaceae TaxID=49546 RepID=UPI001491541F|nr:MULTISPECIES: T9SS type B sorting domain-containing protein [Allomuricauda]MDC6365203.1 T9SS type B sorting domain-containing protein [Muricauda sp. AC10]
MVALLFFPCAAFTQITLDHNVGDIVPSPKFFCNPANNWGRVFELQDFGVSQNSGLTINGAEINIALGIFNRDPIFVRFNVYIIDDDFPDSFPQANLLGSSQTVELNDPSVVFGTGSFQNLTIYFDDPIVVPNNTNRILIEVEETITRPNVIFIASTEDETGPSWFHPVGCAPFTYATTTEFGFPDANYYLKVFGELSSTEEPEIEHKTNCTDLKVDFNLTNIDGIVEVQWDFGDADSGTSNNATDLEPLHEFTLAGIYTVMVTVTTNTGRQFNIVKSVEVSDPVRAYPVSTFFSCEEIQGSGISSTFDTSNVEATVLGGQTGLEVLYFDIEGNPLQSPLPNPFQNTEPKSQTIIIRVTNPKTDCFAETLLQFEVLSIPVINKPLNLYACDEGGGYATFDITDIELQLIDGQTGVEIAYFDMDGNKLPNSLPTIYQNNVPFRETIFVRITNEKDSECFFETSFDLIVSEPLDIGLEEEYHLCHPETKLTLTADTAWDFWQWQDEEGDVLSNSYEVVLTTGGNYSLSVGKADNGIRCDKTFLFTVKESQIPIIEEVRISDFSTNNTVEVLTSKTNNVEYSIDGLYYQQGNIFSNVPGGTHSIFVRNIDGCGTVTKEIFVLDYPKFFTPNNDGVNDYWHIDDIQGFSDANIQIFDRYGKFLIQLTANEIGWDGTLNGRRLPSSDYWFVLSLKDGRIIKKHFTLKR